MSKGEFDSDAATGCGCLIVIVVAILGGIGKCSKDSTREPSSVSTPTSSDKSTSERKESELPATATDDPFAFRNSREMYAVRPCRELLPGDQRLRRMISEIHTQSEAEIRETLMALTELNEVRKAPEVQAVVAVVAERIAAAIQEGRRVSLAGDQQERLEEEFRDIAKILEAGSSASCGVAVRRYLDLTLRHSAFLPAWNNAALMFLHQGYDISAQAVLQGVHQAFPRYVPALINLTVVYERLGEFAQAEEFAREASTVAPEVAQAEFNLRWYDEVNAALAATPQPHAARGTPEPDEQQADGNSSPELDRPSTDAPGPSPQDEKPVEPKGTYRTWTSDTGKYTVVAMFIRRSDDAVELLTEDARLITVPMNRLSTEDQAWVEKQVVRSP